MGLLRFWKVTYKQLLRSFSGFWQFFHLKTPLFLQLFAYPLTPLPYMLRATYFTRRPLPIVSKLTIFCVQLSNLFSHFFVSWHWVFNLTSIVSPFFTSFPIFWVTVSTFFFFISFASIFPWRPILQFEITHSISSFFQFPKKISPAGPIDYVFFSFFRFSNLTIPIEICTHTHTHTHTHPIPFYNPCLFLDSGLFACT